MEDDDFRIAVFVCVEFFCGVCWFGVFLETRREDFRRAYE